jgi:hypothetical protein
VSADQETMIKLAKLENEWWASQEAIEEKGGTEEQRENAWDLFETFYWARRRADVTAEEYEAWKTA